MTHSRSPAQERAVEQREQQQLERFIAHAARSPELQARLKGADPYQVVEIAAAEGFAFSVFTLHRSICTGYVMPSVR